MELNHKIYELADPTIDLTGEKDIRVITNEEDRGVKLPEVFKQLRPFEAGRVIGWSILEYYTIKDGMLSDKEGNLIYLATDKHPKILFKKIRDPFAIYSEIDVTRNYIRDVGLLLNLVNTEETITGLSKQDKQALLDERLLASAEEDRKQKEIEEQELAKAAEIAAKEAEEAAAAAKKAEEEEASKKAQEAADAEARAAQEASEKAEAEAKAAEEAANAARQAEEDARKAEEESRKAAIAAEKKAAEDAKEAAKAAEEKKKKDMEESEFFLNAKQYKSAQVKYARLGYVQYTKDGYHFFYGESDDENENYPFILAEREYGFYEQLPGNIVDENDKTAEYEFSEGDDDKILILNISKAAFMITDQE